MAPCHGADGGSTPPTRTLFFNIAFSTMKTYQEIIDDIQEIIDREGESEDALLAYCQEHASAFPDELRNRIAPLLFEAELRRETKSLEEKNKVALIFASFFEQSKESVS